MDSFYCSKIGSEHKSDIRYHAILKCGVQNSEKIEVISEENKVIEAKEAFWKYYHDINNELKISKMEENSQPLIDVRMFYS